jgi:AcrR family transcriptional regulator
MPPANVFRRTGKDCLLQKPKKKPSATSASAAVPRKRRAPVAPKRLRRSREDILGRIVQAAGDEFKRRGFAGTTTATIARKADVTEAQLFRYFGSKANLFRETIFTPLNQHFMSFINNHLPEVRQDNHRELTGQYIHELQRFITEHSEVLTSLVVAQTYDHGTAHGVGQIDSVRTYFERGTAAMNERLKGSKAKIDPRLLVRVTFVTVLGCMMFKDWIFPRGLASDEDISAAINTFIMEGTSVNAEARSR